MKHTIGTKGPEDSPFVIVGEGPGREEIRPDQNQPFVGESGIVLDYGLSQSDHPEPFISNSIQCYVKLADKDLSQLKLGIDACHGRLVDEIQRHPRKIILALGNGALWSLTGDPALKITKARGRLIPSPLSEFGILAAVHPAFLLRGGGSFRQFKADVDYACDLSRGGSIRRSGASTFSVLQDLDQLRAYAEILKTKPLVASDIETTGFSFLRDRILCVGFSYDGKHVTVVPEELVPHMRPLFQNNCKFLWHNGKFDVRFLWRMGIEEARVDEDTMLQSYTNEERGGFHDLEQVASDWVYSPNWKAMLDKHLPYKGASYEFVPRPILHEYMSYDIANTFNIHQILRPKITRVATSELLYTKTLIPASKFYAHVEMNGLLPDLEYIKANQERLGIEVEKQKAALYEVANTVAPGAFTDKLANSPKQLVALLYGHLGFKQPPKTKKDKWPTDDNAIEYFLEQKPSDPVILALRRHRKVAKAKGTYVDLFFDRLDKKGKVKRRSVIDIDGRVHPTFLIHGTATGRPSSREPNVQNVPRDPLIRGQYVSRKGYIYLEPDLNQAELRSLAVLSRDDALCTIYRTEGMSLHEEVRREIYGDPTTWSNDEIEEYLNQFNLTLENRYVKGQDRIIEEQKMRAKTVNFGVVYGRTAPSVAEEFGTTVDEAQIWIDAWFNKFPQAAMFIKVCRDAPIKGKDLVTPFGMRKRHPLVARTILTKLQNEAANFPHQSIAAHITMHGGMRIEERLRQEFDTIICNTVHDSLLAEAPDDPAIYRQVARIMIEALEQVPIDWGLTYIPFKAEVKMGTRWGHLTKYDPYKPDPIEMKAAA